MLAGWRAFYFDFVALAPLAAAMRALSAALAGCLPTAPAGMLSDAFKVRLRSRLAACDLLRVFSRAFNFGIGSPLDGKVLQVSAYILRSRIAKIAGIAKK